MLQRMLRGLAPARGPRRAAVAAAIVSAGARPPGPTAVVAAVTVVALPVVGTPEATRSSTIIVWRDTAAIIVVRAVHLVASRRASRIGSLEFGE